MSKKVRVVKRRMAAQLDGVSSLAERFSDGQLLELERVAKISSDIDGWPAGGSGMGSTEKSDPTLMAVVKRVSGHVEIDHRQRSAELCAMAVAEAFEAMRRAHQALEVFVNVEEKERGRQSTLTECECCQDAVAGVGGDRIRSGYCPACYQAWNRTRDDQGHRMDRVRFELRRRAEISEEDEAESA